MCLCILLAVFVLYPLHFTLFDACVYQYVWRTTIQYANSWNGKHASSSVCVYKHMLGRHMTNYSMDSLLVFVRKDLYLVSPFSHSFSLFPYALSDLSLSLCPSVTFMLMVYRAITTVTSLLRLLHQIKVKVEVCIVVESNRRINRNVTNNGIL